MSDGFDTGDTWSRLIRWLKAERDNAQDQVMAGTAQPADYYSLCASHAAYKAVLDRIEMIRRGEDLKPPPPRRNWSVET